KICRQGRRRGHCRALYHKWAYSPKERRCVQFVYGGCGGNENNFETKEECELVCRAI
ncbi:UNVERIFIED_CONTAM: hypothetical protein GTU68_048576, partial [Idotea baltica]|nr:hypothetical protein [Idotea baltica]